MSERQAKRMRVAVRRYIAAHKQELSKGPTAERAAELLSAVVVDSWPLLNHKQRGRVMGRIQARGL